MKIGDKVRFLSEVGGGIVKGFQGKDIVLVEDADGFDIPMQVRECVVIETDDYNINRKPAAAPKKAEEPAKPVKPEIPVLQRRPEEMERGPAPQRTDGKGTSAHTYRHTWRMPGNKPLGRLLLE